MARLHAAIRQLQGPIPERRREAPVLLRLDRDPGNAAATSDGSAEPNAARCRRSKNRRAHHRQYRRQRFSPNDPGRDGAQHRHRPGRFRDMLLLIQSFYPPGVGARDLRECLLIQLKREGKGNSLEYKIIQDHMADLGKRRFPEIARRMGIGVEQVQKCANNIAQLDPRPGQIFAAAPQNYVLPDVTVEKIDGQYQVILNGEQIPHLRISNTYKDIMSQDGNGNEVKDYIRDKIRSGKFLIKSIHQRQQTISNIAHEIVKRQKEFLDHGTAHLKPMTMVQIADIVGVHETTVSRAISGKYMSTPQGVFEMKYFFTPGYQTATGESMSNTSVKEAILDLVKNENGASPLSDKEIVEILSERGIPIARRTVAKYRTELNILPSNMRRKY